jgi:hypothetical protein
MSQASDRAATARRISQRAVLGPGQVDSGYEMRADDILAALDAVGKGWTRQMKAEERHSRKRRQRENAWRKQQDVSTPR